MNIIKQFEILFDPSKALGAFLISVLSGVVVSFITGKEVGKRNVIKSKNNAGTINQDVINNINKK